MSESCLMLLPLLIVFLLCQLEPGSRSQSSAEGPYSDVDAPVSLLPLEEVFAFSTLIYELQLSPAPYGSSSYCDKDSYGSSSITITCSVIDNTWHITEIIMNNLRLRGIIHPEVSRLRYLQILDLSNNELHGSIPLHLGSLPHLTQLDLSSNLLSGSIPRTLGNLTSLKRLRLGQNLLNGTIPSSMGNLLSLEELRLEENELVGELPPELGKLGNLLIFHLSSNNLSGTLPYEYELLKNLVEFEVGGNYLTGQIPAYIAHWVNLTDLLLIGNNFEGELPSEIFNMKKLNKLRVSDLNNSNGFTFPVSANLTNIRNLILRNCNISGEIPSYIGDWSTLGYIDLSFNNLVGGIPESLHRLNLAQLFLTENMLNGTIPDWITETVAMGDLSENNFTFGPRQVNIRDFPYNNSKNVTSPGTTINTKPENWTSLYRIMNDHCRGKKSMYHNLFINCGDEDTTIGSNHYDADNTTSSFYSSPGKNWAYSCTGSFLSETTNPNDFIQKLTWGFSSPEAPLYLKARLCPQSLTYYGFCLRKGEYNVTLHFAEPVYANDEDHSSTGKRVFDIYIQGKRVLKDFNVKAMSEGTNKIHKEHFSARVHGGHLLEIRLFWAGKGSMSSFQGPLISAIAVTPNFKVGGLSTIEMVGIIIAAAVLSPLLLLALMWTLWRLGWVGDRESYVTYLELRGKSYSLKQVKDATGNFSSKCEIGRGRFGRVYKATLPDQNVVAVKKLFLQSKVDRIGTEVYASKEKQLKHDNLVELLNVYSKNNLHLLIYEYMEKGSLKQALFDDPNSRVQLDWQRRVNICLGIARGLKYLHEDTSGKIVHRDVKASNIMLDGDFNAKVSDLGLAKIYDEEDPYKFIQEIGTVVNMAPEYAMRKEITEKIDVYSYGIVMLEIISGKSNLKRGEHEKNDYLLNEACVLHSNRRSVELVDRSLSGDFHRRQAVHIFDLAIRCVNLAPTLRPTMSQVVSELEQFSEVPLDDDLD